MSGENIRVVCRIRPLNQKEIANGSKLCVSFPDSCTISVQGKPYTFDAVLPPSTTQAQAYDAIAKPIVEAVLSGYNGTVFAYGQTASGKTHTMEGDRFCSEGKGITLRIVEDIFGRIENMDPNLQFMIKVNYMEIYMEKVKDLFQPKKDNLPIGEDKQKVPYVKGVSDRFVASPDEVMLSLEEGSQNRKIAETNMNARSSRSHALFSMSIMAENGETGKKTNSVIYLVDLAGSEKVGKTGAEGQTLEEAKMINKSLSTLGNVINSLVERHSHVPYRDSKLTRILQNSLGGNSKTTLVICASPASYNEEETKSTIFFGHRAKSIKNLVSKNEQLSAEEWKARYQALLDKYSKLKILADQMAKELAKWRSGGTVDAKHQKAFDAELKKLGEGVEPGVEVAAPPAAEAQKPATKTGALPARGAKDAGASAEAIDNLYGELDMKDEELNKASQQFAATKAELEKLEKHLKKIKSENVENQKRAEKYRNQAEVSKSEVKELLQALEELAQNYDSKVNELEQKNMEIEKYQENYNKLKSSMGEYEMSAKTAKQNVNQQKKRLAELLRSLLDELGEAGEAISPHIGKPPPAEKEGLDAEVISFRLYVGKIKSEVSSIQRRIDEAERSRKVNEAELKDLNEKFSAMEFKCKEMKGKLDAMKSSLKETHKLKKEAENDCNRMKNEIASLQSNLEMANAAKIQGVEKDDLIKKMNEQLKDITSKSDEQIQKIQANLDKSTEEAQALKVEASSLKAAKEALENETDKMKKTLQEKNEKLVTLESQTDRREEAKRELKGLEDNVIRELQTLHNLRKLFVVDLKNRIKKASTKSKTGEVETEDGGGIGDAENQVNTVQKEKIAFLETNLDNLTKVHKQLVRENSELRSEVPKLEKRLKATMERLKQMENALRDSKESAIRDRKRYQAEVEKIKEQIRSRQTMRPATNIVKPIRAGGPRN